MNYISSWLGYWNDNDDNYYDHNNSDDNMNDINDKYNM